MWKAYSLSDVVHKISKIIQVGRSVPVDLLFHLQVFAVEGNGEDKATLNIVRKLLL